MKWSELTSREKRSGLIGGIILVIFIIAIAVVDPFGISEESSGEAGGEDGGGEVGNSLRTRFNSWGEDFNEVRSGYNSLVQDWNDGLISSSAFYSSSEVYYNDSFTGKFQKMEFELYDIDDVAFGTEWDSYSQKMLEGIALCNNGVYYTREYARTGDRVFLTLATDSLEEADTKFSQAKSLMP